MSNYSDQEINRRISENDNNRDKALLTLSSSLLGASVFFIKPEDGGNIWLLSASWIFIAITMLITLYSFDVSTKAHRILWDADNEDDEEKYAQLEEQCDRCFSRVDTLHKMSIIFFTCGIITLLIFGATRFKYSEIRQNRQGSWEEIVMPEKDGTRGQSRPVSSKEKGQTRPVKPKPSSEQGSSNNEK